MSTYLVPVDFSLSSHKAVAYALNLMNKEVDKMVILNVYARPVPDSELPFELMVRMGDSYQEIAETHVKKLLEKIRFEHGDVLDIVGKTTAGFPADEILHQIRESKADVVVMGMRGQNNYMKKLMGTTSTRVVQGTEIPVVVVPEAASYNKIHKIAYATNLEEEDILALDTVTKLANRLDAEVHCVHIHKEGETLDSYKKELLQEGYKDDFVHSSLLIDMEENENLIQGLNRYVELNEIDLLVMLTHHRSVLKYMITGSSTWDMTFQSKVPVWIFQSDGLDYTRQGEIEILRSEKSRVV